MSRGTGPQLRSTQLSFLLLLGQLRGWPALASLALLPTQGLGCGCSWGCMAEPILPLGVAEGKGRGEAQARAMETAQPDCSQLWDPCAQAGRGSHGAPAGRVGPLRVAYGDRALPSPMHLCDSPTQQQRWGLTGEQASQANSEALVAPEPVSCRCHAPCPVQHPGLQPHNQLWGGWG